MTVFEVQDSQQISAKHSINVLFICSMNQWRSPTAEKIYADRQSLNCRSRGTSQKAIQTVSSADIQWADLIFVMEQKHKQRLTADFAGETRYKSIHVLDIPDNFKFMDPELIVEIESATEPILCEILGGES